MSVHSRMRNGKIIVALLVAICLISTIAIGIPKTTAKDEVSKKPKFRKSDNPIMNLPLDMENGIPIVPPDLVERPFDEDAEQELELLIYDVKTKETKRILKDLTKSDKTTLKLSASQGSLPSELVTESVIGGDGRVIVSDTTVYPWRTICKLWMYFPSSGWYMGSGFIIDNYHVLTAGHCVYDPNLNEWATVIEVIPALDGGYGPFYHALATNGVVNSNWYDNGWSTDDFAILTLDRNVGAFTGWMGLAYADPSNSIYTGILNTAGYPADLDPYGRYMYFDSDSGAGADAYNHWYYMDTYGGQSGSPVWYYDDPDRYVLSIHAYGGSTNMGTRLSAYWFSFINDVRIGDTPPTDYANLIDDGQAWSGFSPTTVLPGETSFNVWSDIRNIGTAESGGFQVSYYASTDTDITTSDYLIGTVSVSSILPFYYEDSDWSGTSPNIPAGTYYVGWIIDSTNAVPEPLDYGENNNVAYDDYQLAVHGWLNGWDNRIKMTIDSGDVDEGLENFPVLIYLSTASGINGEDVSFVFDELQNDANRKKIAVTTSDGVTQCYVEIDKWIDASEETWLWVNVPYITSGEDTELYLYYDIDHVDNTAYVGDPSDAVVHNVWDDNFVLVSHMRDDPDVSHVRDSTQYANDGTNYGGGPVETTAGQIDGAQDFDYPNFIDCGNDGSLDPGSELTIEATINTNYQASIIIVAKMDSDNYNSKNLYYLGKVQNKWYFWISGDGTSTGNSANRKMNPLPADGVLNYVVGRFDGPEAILETYLDGNAALGTLTGSIPTAIHADTNVDLTIGRRRYANTPTYFNGIIDELRLSNIARSAAWIKASYESQRDHLNDFGIEESLPVISISVEPGEIGFGTISTGGSGTDTITVTNTGNLAADITATLEDEVPGGFYSDNLELDSSSVTGWSISSLAPDAFTSVVLDLNIPSVTEAGSKTANLIFWAEIP